jgi:hypothetical protein
VAVIGGASYNAPKISSCSAVATRLAVAVRNAANVSRREFRIALRQQRRDAAHHCSRARQPSPSKHLFIRGNCLFILQKYN